MMKKLKNINGNRVEYCSPECLSMQSLQGGTLCQSEQTGVEEYTENTVDWTWENSEETL